MTTIVLQSGVKWGTFPSRSRSGVAGLLPLRHLGSTDLLMDMRLGLSRHLRSHARLQEPAHGSVEAPDCLRRGRLPRPLDREMHLAVSVIDLFVVDRGGPLATEPAAPAGPRAAALLPLQRQPGGARLGGP